jgi:hypothetical protein
MIKRFNQFVFESKYDTLASSYAKDVFDFVKKTSAVPVNRIKTIVLDYQEPIEFSVNVKVVRVHEFKPAAIPDFVNMPWESINFEEKGYAVDANAFIPKASDPDSPEIDVVIYLSPEAEPNCYESLRFKLVDLLRHETEHLLQKGLNQKASHAINGSAKKRHKANDNYSYFLLSDELPAMVSGMHAAAVKRRIPIDQEFEEYLRPFLMSNVISQPEFDQVMTAWIDFAKKSFPKSIFSNKYR